MIPPLTSSGILPPFLPEIGPTNSVGMSPYDASLAEIAENFAFTPKRVAILKGLLEYRSCLRSLGIVDGFQWIDGSYVEDCEGNRQRPPGDIDIVTFAERPGHCKSQDLWAKFFDENKHAFADRSHVKERYCCDAFYVDLGLPGRSIATQTHFWFGLFSHQRISYAWKGMLRIPLQADDDSVLLMLGGKSDET